MFQSRSLHTAMVAGIQYGRPPSTYFRVTVLLNRLTNGQFKQNFYKLDSLITVINNEATCSRQNKASYQMQ